MQTSAHLFVRLFTLLLTLTTAAGNLFPEEVASLDLSGKQTNGQLKDLNFDSVQIESSGNKKSIPSKELSRLSFQNKPSVTGPSILLELVDGTKFVAKDVINSDEGWTVSLFTTTETMKIGKDVIASVQFAALKGQAAESWRQLMSSEQSSDVLTILRGDDLETLSGAIIGIDLQTVQFELDGQLIPAPRSKVAGLVWFRRNRPIATQAIELHLVDGSIVRAINLQLTDRDSKKVLAAETACGLSLVLPLENVHYIEYSSANRKWLDEVEILESTPTSTLANGIKSETRNKLLAPKFIADNNDSALMSGHKDLVFGGPGRFAFRSPAEYSNLVGVIQRNRDAKVVAPITIKIKCDDEEVFSQELAGDQIKLDVKAAIKPNKRCEIEVISQSPNPYGANLSFIQPHLLP